MQLRGCENLYIPPDFHPLNSGTRAEDDRERPPQTEKPKEELITRSSQSEMAAKITRNYPHATEGVFRASVFDAFQAEVDIA